MLAPKSPLVDAASTKLPKSDLRLIAPIHHISGWINKRLMALLMCALNAPWSSFILLSTLYVSSLLLLSTLGAASDVLFMVALSPVLLPIIFALTYIGTALVLLALFARHPGTRLGCAVIVYILLLGPALILSLSDTRLALMLGRDTSFYLILANLLVIPWLALRYQTRLEGYSFLCLPVLALVLAVTWFESSASLSSRTLSSDALTHLDCEWITHRNRRSPTVSRSLLCDVEIQDQGRRLQLYGMPAPSQNITQIEVRQALFQHYRLR